MRIRVWHRSIKSILIRLTYTCAVLLTLENCQGCRREETAVLSERNQSANLGGIPNVGNTCYMNSCLQIARLYPDLFRHMENDLGPYGQAIMDKLTDESTKEQITVEHIQQFYNALLGSYNRVHKEQLQSKAQEDARLVLSFLLGKGNVQSLALYAIRVASEADYDSNTGDEASPGIFLNVDFPNTNQKLLKDALSMDALVASALRGEIVNGAIVGRKLSVQNLRELTNRILPIWVNRYIQKNNRDPRSTTKIPTPITNSLTLTIPPNYFVEAEVVKPYTGTLVGFVGYYNSSGSIDSGHYIAYVKNVAGEWIKYDDDRVLSITPEQAAKAAEQAYLYFYRQDS